MENIPIAGLEELERHLQELFEDQDIPIDVKLFDQVELQLTDSNVSPLIPRLLPPLTQILITYQNDPTILASLAIKLLKPIQFTQALTLASEDSLIDALLSPAPSANILALTIIEKAARSPSDTAILSIMNGVVESFLRTWLSTSSVEFGEKATRALGDLLDVDYDSRSVDEKLNGMDLASRKSPGQGLLWRRIFQDRKIYELIFSLCSLETIGTGEGSLDERQKTLAQTRLLRVILRLAPLDFQTISHTNFPDIESRYGLVQGEQGILWFAAAHMVNKEDMLMHITVIDFFAEFLDIMSTTDITQPTMDYLAALLNKVTLTDQTMYKSLESIARNPETTPELVDLLIRLNQHHQ